MALPDLEKWVTTENVRQFRKQLSATFDEGEPLQLEGLLARELIKLQVVFPDRK